MTPRTPDQLNRTQHRAVMLGGGATLVVLIAALLWPGAALHGYLAAFLLVSAIPLGCLALLLLHHLGGGRWGNGVRPVLSVSVLTLPLCIALFLPILAGMAALYPWTGSPDHGVELLAKKRAYLNVPLFLIRSAAYWLLWGVGVWLLSSRADNRRASADEPFMSRPLGAAGMLLFVFSMSFAAIDWYGSLDPLWYSSIFGLYIIIGQAVAGMAVAILVLGTFDDDRLAAVESDRIHDLGNLLLTMIVLHAYFAYSQFFIIWNGNMPHEIAWYDKRMEGIWSFFGVGIILVHFALPFVALLSRGVKQSHGALMRVAILVLIARVIDCVWIVLPEYGGAKAWTLLWFAIAAVGLGGLWLATFLYFWRQRPSGAEPGMQTQAAPT